MEKIKEKIKQVKEFIIEKTQILIELIKKYYPVVKERYLNFRFKGILAIVCVLFVIAVILFIERSGISINYEHRSLDLLPKEKIVLKENAHKKASKDTLILMNTADPNSVDAWDQFEVILADMKIGYDLIDLTYEVEETTELSVEKTEGETTEKQTEETTYNFDDYESVIVLMADLSPLKNNILTLCEWVQGGGDVLFPLTFSYNGYAGLMERYLGVEDASYTYAVADDIYIEDGFMIGGGRDFPITGGFESSWSVRLAHDDSVKILAHTADEREVPLIWESYYGKGKFVVVNIGMYEKSNRGFYVAAISLLGDISVYPVINGSVFYLDDFPSQIPSGNNEYILRDYGTTIRDFYVNIWWPDMMNFADKYGIKFTGLAIECYDDTVDGTTEEAPDKGTFINFGNMLMRMGGEIGYHGYNHQPLCFGNIDYRGAYDYKTWENYGAMKSAFDALVDFCDELFPDVKMAIYVPPSNILSDEGRSFLLKEYPQIETISGTYFFEQDYMFYCVQEFDVDKNGIVDQPRIISGCDLDEYMELASVSELNYRYVNSHFTHPDDALDPERGAEDGWEYLEASFDEYLNWLYTSAPNLRNFTGSEMSAAVQRYVGTSVKKTVKGNTLTLKVNNFYDEAHFMVRFNNGKTPDKITGGEITHMTGDLYQVTANADKVTITLK